jgi:predicted MPP superfamily phosphohydrolase
MIYDTTQKESFVKIPACYATGISANNFDIKTMKIISYSDIHLEFGRNFQPPADVNADVMILAGDMITFRNFEPLGWMLKDWHKPVLFVAGNHE